jgi:hypothetical protein
MGNEKKSLNEGYQPQLGNGKFGYQPNVNNGETKGYQPTQQTQASSGTSIPPQGGSNVKPPSNK